jgi:hypothetical protein
MHEALQSNLPLLLEATFDVFWVILVLALMGGQKDKKPSSKSGLLD